MKYLVIKPIDKTFNNRQIKEKKICNTNKEIAEYLGVHWKQLERAWRDIREGVNRKGMVFKYIKSCEVYKFTDKEWRIINDKKCNWPIKYRKKFNRELYERNRDIFLKYYKLINY